MYLVYINAGKTPPETSCSTVFWRRSMAGFRGGPGKFLRNFHKQRQMVTSSVIFFVKYWDANRPRKFPLLANTHIILAVNVQT